MLAKGASNEKDFQFLTHCTYKELIMVPRWCNARSPQTLWRSREPVLALHRAKVSGPITALAAASPRKKVTILGRRTSGPCGWRKEGPQGCNGSVNTLVLCRRGTIISPLLSPVHAMLLLVFTVWMKSPPLQHLHYWFTSVPVPRWEAVFSLFRIPLPILLFLAGRLPPLLRSPVVPHLSAREM